jgi:polyhydroxyalkanoate synthase
MTKGSPESPGQFADLTVDLGRAVRRAGALQPVSVGGSSREPVHRTGKATLYRYGEAAGPPLLIVYSLVNRPYILDLTPERSVISALGAAGFTVYLLDWGYPDAMDRFLSLGDYIEDELDEAVAYIAGSHGRESINVLGVCQGGVFALCYAALHPDRVANLVTLVTPVDFQTPGDALYRLARHVDMEAVVRATGNVPALGLNTIFAGLRPFQLLVQRYLALADIAENDEALTEFLRMERWMYDSPDQAGRAFAEFARDFYQHNALVGGTLRIGDRHVDPGRVTMPVFNAYAEADHLVPPAAARAMAEVIGSTDYEEASTPGGHLGIFISRRAHRDLYPRLAAWLTARQGQGA